MKSKSDELFDFKEIYLPVVKHLDRVRREVGQPQVMIDEAGKRDVRGCFTAEDVLQSHHYPEQAH